MRQYFVTKIEADTDAPGLFVVTAKAVSTDPTKKARSVLQVPTNDPQKFTIGQEVLPDLRAV